MRILLSIAAIFSLCALQAQSVATSHGRELPRSRMLVYPTQAEAAAADDSSDNGYSTRITEWLRSDETFITPFTVPFAWANRQVLLRIDRASADYDVCINGREVAYNSDGEAPAEFNITRYVNEGRNRLEIRLRTPSAMSALESWKQEGEPYIGKCRIISQPTLRIRDVVTRTRRSDTAGEATAEIGIVLKSDALNPRTSRIHYELLTPSGERAASGAEDITLKMRGEDTLRFLARIPDNLLWSAELPTRYTLRLKTQHEGRFVEYLELPLGFRTLSVQQGRLVVNSKPVALKVREAAPSITEQELLALQDQGYNTLKLQPGAVPPELLDLCDRQGLYVIVQAPVDTSSSGDSRRKGGNPSNDPAWKAAFAERAEDSYHTTKLHPAVIAFALADRSANGICLYESYLNMKRFDEDRPFIYPAADGEWDSDKLLAE